jgi:sugar lactone lactonase YvrE
MKRVAICAALAAAALAGQTPAPFSIETFFSQNSVVNAGGGLTTPSGTAVDGAGNLYISDIAEARVYRRTAAGGLSVFAGSGTPGFSGDGGPAVTAQLQSPAGLALDGAGNLFIADDVRVRRVDVNGIITTVAGNGLTGNFYTDGQLATQVALNSINYTIAVDGSGNLYIPYSPGKIMRVNTAGVVSTAVGIAGDASMLNPVAVATDSAGNIFAGAVDGMYRKAPGAASVKIASYTISGYYDVGAHLSRGVCYYTSFQIKCISAAGQTTVLTGTGFPGLSGDNGPAAAAAINYARGLSFDASGNLFFGDSLNSRVRKITTGNIISTVVKGSLLPTVGFVKHVARDASGNVFVSDENAHVVWRVTPAGVPAVYAGTGTGGWSGDGGLATDSSLFAPHGLAVDATGRLYITELGTHRVRVVGTDGVIQTVAGTGTFGFSGDGGQGKNAALNTPTGVAVDGAGNVFIADAYNNRIRQVSPNGVITTVLGGGPNSGFNSGVSLGDGGPASAALVNDARFVAANLAGDVFVADGARVRKFRPGGTITTVAGNGGCADFGDGGLATAAPLCYVQGLTVDNSGELYISSRYRVRRVDSAGYITTVAGTAVTGLSGDGGPAVDAQLSFPWGIALDGAGGFYVGDVVNQRVRRVHGGTRCTVRLSANAIAIGPGSNNGSLSITTSPACAFTVAADVSWIHPSGSPTVSYAVDTNLGAAARGGSIQVTGGGGRAAFQIHQSGATCQYSLNPTLVNAQSYATLNTVEIVQTPASCAAYQASSSVPWLTVTGPPISSNTSFLEYSIAPNLAPQLRSGVLTVGTRQLTVLQAGGPVSISQPAPGSTIAGGRATFQWTGPTSATYRYEVGTAPGLSNLGSGFTGSLQATVNGLPENGATIYFRLWYNATGSYQGPIDAAYTGLSCTQTISPVTVGFAQAGGSGSFNVSSPSLCAWQATATAGWLHVTGVVSEGGSTGSAGNGQGVVSYTVDANAGTGLRTGGIGVGTGLFTVKQSNTNVVPAVVQTPRDFRALGRSDVLLYNSSTGDGYTGLSDGAGGFGYIYQAYLTGFTHLRSGNFYTGDAKSGMAVYNRNNGFGYIGASDGAGRFTYGSLFWSPGYDSVATGDLNGDGLTDVVLRMNDGTAYTGLSNGNGTFTYKYRLVSPGYTHMFVADFSGDGLADVFLYRNTDGLAHLGVSNGAGDFTFHAVTIDAVFDHLEVGDVNGDGKADVLFYYAGNGVAKLGLGTGTGFTFKTMSWTPGFTAVRLFDFNGDGKSDVALYDGVNANGYLGLGDAAGNFAMSGLYFGPGWDRIIMQDLNGDGKADVMVYKSTDGIMYTGLSSGNPAAPFTFRVGLWGPGKLLAQ